MSREGEGLTIAMATASFFPDIGGTQVFLHNLAEKLIERGHEVAVLVPFSRWLALRDQFGRFPYTIAPLPPKQYAGMAGWPGYWQAQNAYFRVLQRRWDVDIWQAVGTYPAGAALGRFGAAHDVPVVVRTCGEDIQTDEALGYGIRRDGDIDRLVRRHVTACDRMVALTDSVVSHCLEVGMERSAVEVIGCAVDPDRFRDRKVDETAVRERYGVSPDAFAFLSVGRNHPKKGFDVLVDAAARLDEEHSGFEVVVAGKGTAPLADRARERGVRDSFQFPGEIQPEDRGEYSLPPSGILDLYAACDAVVVPSLLETFGNVNVEAMAAGVPLITTDAEGCRDIVAHEHDGLVARRNDPESLAEQMERLLTDPALGRRLARNAAETVAANYTWEVIVDEYEAMYGDVV